MTPVFSSQAFSMIGVFNDVQVDPFQSNKIYVITESYFYFSEDGGENWTQSNKVFNKARNIIADPNYENRIYAGTSEGVFVSNNSGTIWQELNTGLLNHDILCLEYDVENQHLYAGTNGDGVFQLNVDHTTHTSLKNISKIETFQLLQNYPNPFNPSTTIRYNIAKAGRVTLRIYNIAGQKIAKLIDEICIAGEYQITWDANGLPTGIYLARLQTQKEIGTLKLFYLK